MRKRSNKVSAIVITVATLRFLDCFFNFFDCIASASGSVILVVFVYNVNESDETDLNLKSLYYPLKKSGSN